ncbi:MAG TPA: head GIN domain-containing protein [Thermomicrobiales bacterium]|nr:head GIN domain-containing protein [Thermomicrobiales bacterium]
MRRFILAAIVGLAVTLAVSGCSWSESGEALKGSGTVVTESRAVAGFTGVDLSGVGILRITQGAAEALTIQTDDNLLPLITTQVRNGTLIIAIDTKDHPHGVDPTTLVYDLTVTSLQALSVAGAAQVEGRSIAADDLRLEISGAAKVDFDQIQAKALHVTSAGGSAFTIAGTVDMQEIVITGAGEYRAKGLASRTATVRITGAGHATIAVAEALDASIDGTGLIEYVGSPTVVQHVTGLGVIRQVEA